MDGNIAAALFDAGVRVDRTIWLDGCVCADAASPHFDEAFCDLQDGEHLSEIFPEIPAVFDGNANDALEFLVSARGVLVEAAAPVRKYVDGGPSYYSGWGHYRTKWFRAANLESTVHHILAWAEAMAERDQKKSVKGT